ncbi:MAG: EamA family transporter [Candidatus Omnitrophica bacterium]|nr:EamA family transporter [Candidatus Omnitrophota bacterium]
MLIFILLILTAVLWGASPILEKLGLRDVSPLVALTIRSIGVAVVLLITMGCMGKLKEIFTVDARTIAIFVLSGIMAGFLGMWTYFGALKAGATSKVVPIAACYPLVTAFLSVLILKESITVPRLIGTLLIIGGIWLVK